MNKPATKEPSMDEILSSIRQIIADDDAAAAPPPKPSIPAPPVAARATEPLPLSAAQIVSRSAPPPAMPDPIEAMMSPPLGEPALLDPEDVNFEPEMETEPEPVPVPVPVMRTAPVPPAARPAPRPAASVAQAAPMPDPSLSSDMAEELLAPTTNAAVSSTMARLSAVSAVGGGQTIEGMMRELMRPMLKEWLDENLPALVERVVEKEIVRISRGVK